LASSPQDLEAVQRLRFEVFNLELQEGLAESWTTGLDADAFDGACQHLLVEEKETGQVVGTYRLQTGDSAASHLGYYSEQEFEFAPFESIRSQIVELGRACVLASHRNLFVLGLLWKGIGSFALEHHSRYLIGCSSITSQDPAVGAWAYDHMAARWLAEPAWRTVPTPAYHCPMAERALEPVKIPKLLRAYLNLGGRICGPPALDPHFKTLDFLTMLDLEGLGPEDRQRFLA
jgi:putative hemolysin